MQEKAAFMGIADMPLLRPIDNQEAMITKSLQMPQQRRQTLIPNTVDIMVNNEQHHLLATRSLGQSMTDVTPIIALNHNNHIFKPFNFESAKHDTRLVNEAFQVIE
jgi:hypothetical protein